LKLEVLNPLDTFIERNPNEFYINRSSRAVIRRFMTREQIFAEFASELTPEAKAKLREVEGTGRENGNYVYVKTGRFDNLVQFPQTKGLLAGLEVHPTLDGDRGYEYSQTVYTVYEVEWLE
jgi:topoisomerase IA-like protein